MDRRPEDETEQSTENNVSPEEINPDDDLERPQEFPQDNQPVELSKSSDTRDIRSETDVSESKEYDDTASDYEEEHRNIPESRDLGISRYGRVRVARRDPDFVYQPLKSKNIFFLFLTRLLIILYVTLFQSVSLISGHALFRFCTEASQMSSFFSRFFCEGFCIRLAGISPTLFVRLIVLFLFFVQ